MNEWDDYITDLQMDNVNLKRANARLQQAIAQIRQKANAALIDGDESGDCRMALNDIRNQCDDILKPLTEEVHHVS